MSSNCTHITTVGDYSKEDILRKQELSKCDSCDCQGPNLWLCLHLDCLYVGCGELHDDHSTKHFQAKQDHSLTLNLTTLRVWCYLCECEVFLENNDPPLAPGILSSQHISASKVYVADIDSDEDEESENQNLKPRGLTGLQNLGNTCYMNAAIQALSNCPQLTCFFRDCGAFVRSDKKPGLAKSYMRLIREIWHKRRPSYVVPSAIAYGIKFAFPVFRGYAQQDAQEFLRCFMDQLHEELKEPKIEVESCGAISPDSPEEFDSCQGESALGISEDSSQSEAEFETCDSGLSSEKSSCIEDCIEQREGVIANEEDCQDASLLVNTNQEGHLQNQIPNYHSHPSNKSAEVNKEKEVYNSVRSLSSKEDHRHYGGIDWSSDSGVQGNHSVDISEAGSYLDGKTSPASRTGEKYSESKKTNYMGISNRQQLDSQRQILQRNSIRQIQNQNQLFAKIGPRKKKPVQYHSVISDIFDGKIVSSVQCLTCDTLSTTKETFQDLSLPIPGRDHLHMLHASHNNQQKGTNACSDVYSNRSWLGSMLDWIISWFWGPTISLQDCLSAFFSADELKGDNMYSCEKCKKLRNGIKYSRVLQLPEILCIHLKRFRHEVMFSSKISSNVSFPLEGLDMSPFLHKDCSRGVTTYDLVAVICHHGTAGSGHYTAYGLNYLNEQWYEFDDQCVTAVDPQVVQNCEAYVLFYRKSSEEMIKKRQRAIELMERSKREPGLLHFYISKQWANKFNTFAEPGPITNNDFLCIHGGVPPNKVMFVDDLCTELSQAVWEYLHDTFGGGPSCTHLYSCPICQAEQECLDRRRKQEHDIFVMLNKEFQNQDSPPAIYAISMNWFKQWENFVRSKEYDPPGPIDNNNICYMKGNQGILKLGSDYGSLSEEMWIFLHNIYGGGPDVFLQNVSCVNMTNPNSQSAGIHASSSSSSRISSQSTGGISSSSTCNSKPSSNISSHNYPSNISGKSKVVNETLKTLAEAKSSMDTCRNDDDPETE